MIKKYKNKWGTILLAIGFLLMTGSSAWAKSDDTRTITSQEIRESAESYLINHLDWNPESMDIEINLGEIVSITGTNGAGKSSVLNAISGIHHPNGGEIIL